MSDAASCKAKEISLGDDFGDVAVKVNGVRIVVARTGVLRLIRRAGSMPTRMVP
jgi:hypothetical protein